MANKTAEELFAEGCSHLRYSHHKYDDTKGYEATTENDFMAKDFFEKAAKQDYAPALRELARCYIEGYGVMFKNKTTKGIKYLCQAVLAGDKNALDYCIEREDFFSKLTDSDACAYLKQISDYHDALVSKEAETEKKEENNEIEDEVSLGEDTMSEKTTEEALNSEELNSKKYLEQVENIYKNARNAIVELLKQNGEKQYVIIEKEENSDDKCVETTDGVGCANIFGVGLNAEDHLVVAADCVGMYDGDIPRKWIDPEEWFTTNYADLYRFVAENITKNHTDDEATEIAKEWWGEEVVNIFGDPNDNEDDTVDEELYDDEEEIVYPAHLIIEDGVERIEENAYSEHEEIESIEMPDSVTYIGDDAFQGCSNLRTIKFSANLETIDTGAFSGCNSLTEIILPEGLTTIEGAVMFSSGSFAKCESLNKVTLPKSISWIGGWAFEGCGNLKSITIKNTDPSTIMDNDNPIAEDSLYETCTLIVPNGSIEAYKNHKMFRKFKNIISE